MKFGLEAEQPPSLSAPPGVAPRVSLDGSLTAGKLALRGRVRAAGEGTSVAP